MLETRSMMKERYVLLRKEGVVKKSVTSKGEGLGQPLTAEQISERKKKLTRTPYSDWAGELLGPSEAAEVLGVSRSTLNNWKRNGEIIALPKGKTHSVIPMAQFEEGSILSGTKEVLAAAYGNNITAWRWLVYPHVDFDGDPPIDFLRAGKVDEVARLAEVSLSGCDSHMGSFFIWHILSPIETFAKVEAMSESRSIEDLPIVICCSFEWIPVFS